MSYTYKIEPSQIVQSTYNYTATVTAYDEVNRIVTLNNSVDISLGYNETVGDITSQYSFVGTQASIKAGQGLPNLSTDEGGSFVGIFNVPPNIFQTGQRVFRVDNRSVATDPTTATTYAQATFTASGLSTVSQKLEFAPSIDSSVTQFTQVSQKNNQLIASSTIRTVTSKDPLAQTFIVEKDNYPNGMFIKSVKVFFYSKPTTEVPVKLSIVNTLNGYPNGQKLDHSTVMLSSSQIVTSISPHYLDSSTYTEFVFDAPVYIQSGVLYAFMLEASSPDYQVYFAEQNSTAVPSTAKATPTDVNPTVTKKIGASPYVGALFESQNSITWTADQTKNLMFVIDRCVFDTTKIPSIQFSLPKGLPYRKVGVNDIQYTLDPNNVKNLHGNFSNANTGSDAINLTTTDFIPDATKIDYSYSATLANGNVPVGPYQVFPGKYGSPTPNNIDYDDGLGQRALLKGFDNSISMYALLSSSDPNVSPIISDDAISVYNIRYVINNMGIQNNVVSLTNVGAGYNDSTNTLISISAPDVGSDNALLGLTIANNGTSNVISSVYVTYPGSGYTTTPKITISGANTTQATAVVYGETSPKGGNSFAKYFTKKVILAPENDSADLRVFYTAYKPLGTRVDVYYKILNRNDTSNFDDLSWQLMTQIKNSNVYSQSKTNLIEYEFAPGKLNQADNFISYTSTNGQTYSSFSQFAIKIVMSSSDSTIIPKLTDIRALALPSGTGI
jgi:hypothetical protein